MEVSVINHAYTEYYIGVYGVTWPTWPASENIDISSSKSNINITAVSAVSNLNLTITLPASSTAPYHVWYGPDSLGDNMKQDGVCSGSTISFTSGLAMYPGNYRILCWVDSNNNGVHDAGDFIGWYNGGSSTPLTTFPVSPNCPITDLSTINSFSFTLDTATGTFDLPSCDPQYNCY
jgi:hypothetical protein